MLYAGTIIQDPRAPKLVPVLPLVAATTRSRYLDRTCGLLASAGRLKICSRYLPQGGMHDVGLRFRCYGVVLLVMGSGLLLLSVCVAVLLSVLVMVLECIPTPRMHTCMRRPSIHLSEESCRHPLSALAVI